MPTHTIRTPFTEAQIASIPISRNNGIAINMADPGTYTLRCAEPWYHHTADNTAVGSMTRVEGNEYLTVEVTDTPVTKYIKSATDTGEVLLAVFYDQPSSASGGGVAPDGNGNLAIGDETTLPSPTGVDNIGIGVGALNAITEANNNVAIGTDALGNVTDGGVNVAVGRSALGGLTTGAGNVAVGNSAAPGLTSGDNNVAIGRTAGNTLTTGANNTFVGRLAGAEVTTGQSNVMIGAQAGLDRGNVSNMYCLGPIAFTVDEGGNLLNISVRYSDGSFKTVTGLALS